MAVQVFDLRDVPDDEEKDILQLLSTHCIDYYETPAGRWGISSPGFWIRDDTQWALVSNLIARYESERAIQARKFYEEQQALGVQPTLWDSVAQYPLRVVAVLLVVGFVLYVSVVPFFGVAG